MKPDISAWENEGGAAPAHCDEFENRETINVTIYDRGGRAFTYSAIAADFHSAVRRAAAWFRDFNVCGPKPTRDTVYELTVPGNSKKWHVCGGTVKTVE